MHCFRRLSHWPWSTAAHYKVVTPGISLRCGSPTQLRHASSISELSEGQKLLKYWQVLLGNADCTDTSEADRVHVKTEWKTEDIRHLLHTAVRMRQGRVSGVLPEQLMSTFVQVYRNAMNAEDRLRLFQLLCKDFGAQGKLATLP